MIHTNLDVEALVFVHHHQRSRHTPRQRSGTAHEFRKSLENEVPHSIAESEYLTEVRPVFVLLRDLGVVVAVIGIIDVRVDAAFEDGREVARFNHRNAKELRQKQSVERGEMADIEQRLVTQVNGLLVKHRGGNHAQRDQVPGRP